MKHQPLFLCVLLLGMKLIAYGQPGSLDKSFAGNGLLRTIISSYTTANDVKVQPNGKIVVAGQYSTPQHIFNFLVERYNTDGSFDNSFAGGDGEQGISFGDHSEADAVALQADGKIVASGSGDGPDQGNFFVVVRLNTNGSADNSFGTGGKLALTNLKCMGQNAVAIQADGKILVAGSSPTGGTSLLTVFRLNSNGSFDNSFGTNGVETMSVGTGQYTNYVHLALQPDGKIAICCSLVTVYVDHEEATAVVLRMNSNGGLDNTFGTGGIVSQSVGSQHYTTANCIALQNDNKIIVGGSYGTSSSQYTNFLVMRFNPNGTLDNTFAGNGRAGIAFSPTSGANGIAVQTNGDIIAGGFTQSSTDEDFALVRLLPNGTPDANFGSAGTGKVTTGFGYYDYLNAVTLQPDGKILAVGTSGNDMALARYLVTVATARLLAPGIAQTAFSKTSSLQPALFPNPANGTIQLTGLDPQSVNHYSITDASGKTLISDNVSFAATAQINTAQWRKGVYFIQLTTNNKTTTLRVVKQ
jgi:uncharacterized delta-60 repeat protein